MFEDSGIINLLKPPGLTSFAAVSRVRRILKIKKAGHTGTLDPDATGVLPICLGKATKIIPFIKEEKKEYVAEMILGCVSDTLDISGVILENNDRWQYLNDVQVKEAIYNFIGEIEQIPPMYSALRYKGKRLYQLAREGKVIEREPRKVCIYDIKVLSINLPKIRILVSCSKGTYIRSLVADIGKKLGTGALLSFLIRTRSGPFFLAKAVTFEDIFTEWQNHLLPIDFPLSFPKLVIKDEVEKKVVNGVFLTKNDFKNDFSDLDIGKKVLIYNTEGSFLSLNEVILSKEKQIQYKPKRVFSR